VAPSPEKEAQGGEREPTQRQDDQSSSDELNELVKKGPRGLDKVKQT